MLTEWNYFIAPVMTFAIPKVDTFTSRATPPRGRLSLVTRGTVIRTRASETRPRHHGSPVMPFRDHLAARYPFHVHVVHHRRGIQPGLPWHSRISCSSSRWTTLPELFYLVNNVSEIEVSEA